MLWGRVEVEMCLIQKEKKHAPKYIENPLWAPVWNVVHSSEFVFGKSRAAARDFYGIQTHECRRKAFVVKNKQTKCSVYCLKWITLSIWFSERNKLRTRSSKDVLPISVALTMPSCAVVEGGHHRSYLQVIVLNYIRGFLYIITYAVWNCLVSLMSTITLKRGGSKIPQLRFKSKRVWTLQS